MDVLSSLHGFDWDEGNVQKNWEKHHVTPLECEQVFFTRPFVVIEDGLHSEDEARYYVLGRTDAGRLLFVVFTIRNGRIRVISARDMNKKERRQYYEEVKKEAEIQE